VTDALEAPVAGHFAHLPELVIDESAQQFLQRWVHDNAYLGERAQLLGRWLVDATPREDIAARMGIPLGQLLRTLNDTAPLGPSCPFRYRTASFAVVAMAGVCDDLAGDRYPLFGEPVTLRCYLQDSTLLPQGMLEAADWNYMDGGLAGFVGYAYGVRHEDTLYLAGVQSDIGVRYGYLFQGRGGTTEIRVGDEVVPRAAAEVAGDYEQYVPVLRRTFQRYWIPILLAAALTWAQHDGQISRLGLLQFPREPQEDRRGHVVHRVYQELPERLGASLRHVVIDQHAFPYAVAPLALVERYLGGRWQRGEG
jgi:hypothetical protein